MQSSFAYFDSISNATIASYRLNAIKILAIKILAIKIHKRDPTQESDLAIKFDLLNKRSIPGKKIWKKNNKSRIFLVFQKTASQYNGIDNKQAECKIISH